MCATAFACCASLPDSPSSPLLTLALAIGANAVVFGVLNALILRPLNVPQAQSLYAIERGEHQAINHSYPDYLDLRDRNRSFEGLAAYNLAEAGLDTGKESIRRLGARGDGELLRRA